METATRIITHEWMALLWIGVLATAALLWGTSGSV